MFRQKDKRSIRKSTGKDVLFSNVQDVLFSNIQLYRMLYSSDGLSPRFYGLRKIYKTGIPLRPIVSFINSPTYDVSSYLAKILSPVVGNTVNTVKNSLEFADFIRGKTLDAEDELVSFDVVSLFTKIPVDLAIEVAKKRLREDVSLEKRT